MRSDPAAVVTLAALLLFAAPAPASTGTVTWLHVCGSDTLIPLRLPGRKQDDQRRACHSACLGCEKKRLRMPRG